MNQPIFPFDGARPKRLPQKKGITPEEIWVGSLLYGSGELARTRESSVEV